MMTIKKAYNRAFTLIELLVALSVTALMVALMLTIVTNVLSGWNRSTGTLTAGNQARLLLDQIATDLQGAIVKRDGNGWLVATIQQDQSSASGDTGLSSAEVFFPRWNPVAPLACKPMGATSFDPAATRASATPSLNIDAAERGKLEQVRFGQTGVWLRFFSTPPDKNAVIADYTAPQAISYQMTRAHAGGQNAGRTTAISYYLFRSVVTAQNTFAAGYDLAASTLYNAPAGTDGVAGTVRQPNAAHLIANDVIDFGVRIFERDATGALYEAFPVRRTTAGIVVTAPASAPFSYVATSNATPSYLEKGGTLAKTVGGIPVVVEVMVRILTPEGVKKIQAYEENPASFGGASDAKWWELAEANSKVYVRRIELRSSAL
jgi:prepilin-type N-terminal cleavage/methylation domain-containing protein